MDTTGKYLRSQGNGIRTSPLLGHAFLKRRSPFVATAPNAATGAENPQQHEARFSAGSSSITGSTEPHDSILAE